MNLTTGTSRALTRRVAAAAAALVLGLALTGCGGDSDDNEGSTSSSAETVEGAAAEGAAAEGAGAEGAAGEGGDGERAFDADADAAAVAVQAATRAERTEWDGKTLRAHFDEGSVDDAISHAKCGASAVLAADEKLVLHFPDGEFDCSER